MTCLIKSVKEINKNRKQEKILKFWNWLRDQFPPIYSMQSCLKVTSLNPTKILNTEEDIYAKIARKF
ncbi:hypothetical protein BpHYR1_031216 [Brachionus plicatilis]|uniref:Uncharacterized protein n=1 Tax=Brachionus plicatilis TaxID=10195 RepID=A0A3M7Q9V1_BRAPC|nr:hypothetical protein BpHYR1_031216 [Brachionus plicatilis]